MLHSSESTESHIIGPVEAPIVLWMLHSLRPVILLLQVLYDFLSCVCIFLDRVQIISLLLLLVLFLLSYDSSVKLLDHRVDLRFSCSRSSILVCNLSVTMDIDSATVDLFTATTVDLLEVLVLAIFGDDSFRIIRLRCIVLLTLFSTDRVCALETRSLRTSKSLLCCLSY